MRGVFCLVFQSLFSPMHCHGYAKIAMDYMQCTMLFMHSQLYFWNRIMHGRRGNFDYGTSMSHGVESSGFFLVSLHIISFNATEPLYIHVHIFLKNDSSCVALLGDLIITSSNSRVLIGILDSTLSIEFRLLIIRRDLYKDDFRLSESTLAVSLRLSNRNRKH